MLKFLETRKGNSHELIDNIDEFLVYLMSKGNSDMNDEVIGEKTLESIKKSNLNVAEFNQYVAHFQKIFLNCGNRMLNLMNENESKCFFEAIRVFDPQRKSKMNASIVNYINILKGVQPPLSKELLQE